MKTLIVTTILTAMFLGGIPIIAPPVAHAAIAQISFGIRIGPPPAPRVLKVRPKQPGSDYIWVEGYWYPAGNHKTYQWHAGYWTRPPYAGATWIAPHHDGQMFFDGYWQAGDKRYEHDHGTDRNRDRDYRH